MSIEDVRLPSVVEEETRQSLLLLEGLRPEVLTATSGVGEWTRRDLVAHVAGSARTYTGWIERELDGITEPPPGRNFVRGQAATDAIAARVSSTGEAFPEGPVEALTGLSAGLATILAQLGTEDYFRPVFHPTGVTTIRNLVRFRVAELALHRWDMENGLGRDAHLSEIAVEVLYDWSIHWLEICFAPAEAGAPIVVYHFDIEGQPGLKVAVLPDEVFFDEVELVVGPTFVLDAEMYVLFVAGRVSYDDAVASGRMRVEGDELATRSFRERFPAL